MHPELEHAKLNNTDLKIIRFFGDPNIKNHSNKELAAALGVTEGSAKEYLFRTTQKLNLDRIGVALLGYDMWLEEQTNDIPKVKEQEIRTGSQRAAENKPIAAPTPFFRDYKYKSLRPDFLEIP